MFLFIIKITKVFGVDYFDIKKKYMYLLFVYKITNKLKTCF